jgi:hypothetical protein
VIEKDRHCDNILSPVGFHHYAMPISICHESTHPAGAQKQLNIHETCRGGWGSLGRPTSFTPMVILWWFNGDLMGFTLS